MSSDSKVLDQATLRRRARWGVFALTARTVVQQLVTLLGNVYLARILGPGDFGAFWIVQYALAFFVLFGDAGFGAALIQKKELATQEELSSVFWAQMLLGAAVVLVVFVAAPWVVSAWPDLPTSSLWMMRALSLELVLTSLRVVPAIIMERELLFGRLAVVDLVLTISFYSSAVALALLGYGVNALVVAVLVQGASGIVVVYAFRPWLPSFKLNMAVLRPILAFGTAFQLKHLVGFLNAAVMPWYGGIILGKKPFGLIAWAQRTAFFPLTAIDALARVNFPLLSRLQHDSQAFAKTLERTIYMCATVVLLFVGLFLGLGPPIVKVIYGDQWLPAIPPFYVFTVAIAIGFITPVISGAFDALGKPQVILRLSVGWMIFNWIAVLAVMHFRSNVLWFSIGYCLHIFIGNLAVVYAVKKTVPGVGFLQAFRPGVPAALVTAATGRWLLAPVATGPWSLTGSILGAVLVFIGVLGILDATLLREVTEMIRKKEAATL